MYRGQGDFKPTHEPKLQYFSVFTSQISTL